MLIVTDRLRIDSFDPDADAPAAARIYADPVVMRHVAGGAHVSQAQTAALLAEYARQQDESGYSYWAVRRRADGQLIGDCGVYPIEGRGPEIELGFTFAAGCWGQGLATEAARACITYAYDELGIAELRALVVPEHAASRRVLEKLGFAPLCSRVAYGEPHLELVLRDARGRTLETAARVDS